MNITIILILLILCCISTVVFQYFIRFGFNEDIISYLLYVLINFIPMILTINNILENELLSEIVSTEEVFDYKSEIYKLFVSIFFPIFSIPHAFFKVIKLHVLRDINHEQINFSNLFKVHNGMLMMIISNLISIVFYSIFIVNQIKNLNRDRVKTISERTKKDIEANEIKLKELDDDVYREYQRVVNANALPTQEQASSVSIQKDSEKMNHDYNDSHEDSHDEMIIKKEVHVNINNVQKEKSATIPIRVVNVGKEHTCFKEISDPDKALELVNNKNPKYGDYHYSDYSSGLIVTSLKDVTLGINQHECYGLIGPNGSGKTTLLNIITYNSTQTVGKIYYDDVESTAIKEDHLMMGYCPQNDILWEELTLYEHLVMFIYLRGYTRKESHRLAEKYMEFCKIEDHKNKYPHELSGGTRRKLCILIALISFSNKIMLDEPTSGMDPATRRYIWNVLTNYKHHENSMIVLTTHSMEEAEILCDRIGMLVNGELLATGSPIHLKLKFGNTYTLEIQCTDAKLVDEWIKKDIPRINQKEMICEFKSDKRVKYTFKIMDHHGEIFKTMENYKTKGIVIDYSFSQTSLEDIFLKFANYQENQEM